MSEQTHNEAPLSVNFRMVHTGETFQFTLRDSEESSFVARLNALVVRLGQEGWQFLAEVNGGMVAPSEQPVPNRGAPLRVPSGTPGTSPAPKTEQIDGYVVSTVSNGDVCVHLYTKQGKYKQYTAYPQHASLLPFPYPTVPEWPSGAPDKDTAIAQKYYHPMQFQVLVVPETEKDGTLKLNTKGYQRYRLPRVGEMSSLTQGGLNPAANNTKVPVPGLVNLEYNPKELPNAHALRHTMVMDDAVAVARFKIPAPLDEWVIDLRAGISSLPDLDSTDPKTYATQAQWDALQQWAVQEAGSVAGGTDIMVEDVGRVPLAGVLIAMLIDRFVTSHKDVPAKLMVALLQRVMTSRSGSDNPTYNLDFDQNISEALRCGVEALVGEVELLF